MLSNNLPIIFVIGVALVAYRYSGIGAWFQEFIKKDLRPSYDYIIGTV